MPLNHVYTESRKRSAVTQTALVMRSLWCSKSGETYWSRIGERWTWHKTRQLIESCKSRKTQPTGLLFWLNCFGHFAQANCIKENRKKTEASSRLNKNRMSMTLYKACEVWRLHWSISLLRGGKAQDNKTNNPFEPEKHLSNLGPQLRTQHSNTVDLSKPMLRRCVLGNWLAAM